MKTDQTEPSSAELQQAIAAMEAGDIAGARAIVDEVMRGESVDIRFFFVAAQLCLYEDDFEGLERIADALLEGAPDMVIAHVWKGDARRAAGDRDATLSSYESAVAQAERMPALPPAVEAAVNRARGELPTLRRQAKDARGT